MTTRKRLGFTAGFYALLALAASPAMGAAAQHKEDYSAWFRCNHNTDCIILPGTACDGQISLNRNYAQRYQSYDHDLTGIDACEKPEPDDPNAYPICAQGTCSMSSTSPVD